jgi:hypothetical protein
MARRRFGWLLPLATFFIKNWTWITSTAAGAIVSWLASLSPLVSKYAPLSYAVIFLLSAAVVMGMITLIFVAAERWAKRVFWIHVQEPTRTVNPLDHSYTGIRVSLLEVAEPDVRVIRGKTFVDCELIGRRLPFLYLGCHFHPPMFLSGCDLMALPLQAGKPLPRLDNAIVVVDCTFRNCKFYYQTMLFSEHDARMMNVASGNTLPWLIPPSPEPSAVP